MTEVTIVIPSYNSGENLLACVYSLRNQKPDDIKYDIIIVDSSNDNTADLLN